jgi:hypothetical protein
MAENIVAGLFGLSPEMYGEQQRRSALQEGITLANLDPASRGAAMTYGGARGLGTAIGGAMGVEDPQLKLISARNAIAQQIDQSNPESILKGAQMLAQAGDQQGAMALAQYARQAQSEMAQTQQRLAAGKASLAAAGRERVQADPEKVRLAREVATLSGPEGSIEYNTAYAKSLREQVEPKGEKDARFGTDRESVSAELYDKSFAQLTTAERAIVNKRVEEEQGKKAEKGAAKLTNVMPGQEKFVDIPEFRAKVQKTIAPQIESVTAADQALQAINDSITSNNFVSFNAARVQLAKALGDSQLSRRDVEQAGGDPSLFGKLLDSTSTLFTGTPTLETQNLIKNTLQAVKMVSTNKANREINVQRDIAYNTPGYDKPRVDMALRFPEFEATKEGQISGDLAAQARALLKKRQEAKK